MADFTFQMATFLHSIVFNPISLTLGAIIVWGGVAYLVFLLVREYFKQRGIQGE